MSVCPCESPGVCVCLGRSLSLWFPRECAWMSLHVVGLLQCLFVSPPVWRVRVSPFVVYSHLCESAGVCLLQGGSVGAGLSVPVLFGVVCLSCVGAGPQGGHQTDSSPLRSLSSCV